MPTPHGQKEEVDEGRVAAQRGMTKGTTACRSPPEPWKQPRGREEGLAGRRGVECGNFRRRKLRFVVLGLQCQGRGMRGAVALQFGAAPQCDAWRGGRLAHRLDVLVSIADRIARIDRLHLQDRGQRRCGLYRWSRCGAGQRTAQQQPRHPCAGPAGQVISRGE